MIIGVCGFIGSGKDTFAEMLVEGHLFKRESFAGSLKDAVAAVFNWDRKLLEGDTKESRDWRETKDEWWADRLGIPHLTPRWVLQNWGTEVCRQGFHDDIWVASIENKLANSVQDIVISDCRFVNEIVAIKKAGGKIVRVIRGENPEWYETALEYNSNINANGSEFDDLIKNVHLSEWAWVGTNFDYVIDNNGSLEELQELSNKFVLSCRGEVK